MRCQLNFVSIMLKRTFSKKQFSTHKEVNINQELSNIQNNQLTADSIIDKLLRPNLIDKKQSQNQKYRPKFEKRDYQTLSKQNMTLKMELKAEKQNVTQLKFKLSEAERKTKFLEGMQEKWEKSVQEDHDGKRLEVYTEILKKKIQDLNELYLGSEQKIKQLKTLPHISIFDEQTIQMEHMQRQTVRLKSLIASLPSNLAQDDNLENKLLKLMKQENEKLKATIRLLENDKNLLKSRQTIQKRQITDFKKDIEDLRRKLTIRQAELQKAMNQTKNIQLQKAFQIQLDQQRKDNDQIGRLRNLLEENRQDMQRLEAEKEQLTVEYMKLKKNEKLMQIKQTNQDKQKSELRADNSHLRRQIEDMKMQLDRQQQNNRLLEQHSKKRRSLKFKTMAVPIKIEKITAIKLEQLELPLMMIIHCLDTGSLEQLGDLLPVEEELRCERVVQMLTEQPVSLENSEAVKLVRYMTEDQQTDRLGYNRKLLVNRQLCLTILKAAINKMLECRNSTNQDIWRCLLAKARRLIPELEKQRGQTITKEAFLNILTRHINQPFGEYITLLLLQCGNWEQCDLEVVLSIDKILETFAKLIKGIPLH